MTTDPEDSFKLLRLRFLRPPPAFVELPSASGGEKKRGYKVPITLAVGVTDDYGVHIDSFDSLDLYLSLLDPVSSLPLANLSLTLASSSPPSSSFTLTPASGPYTTLPLTLHIPPSSTPPTSFRILLSVKPPSSKPPTEWSPISERMKAVIGETGQSILEGWKGERWICMRAMSGEVEVRMGKGGSKGEGSASSEKVQIIYRTIHLPSPLCPSSSFPSFLPPLTVVERPGLNNSTGQRLWDCAIGMSCWLSLHPEVLLPPSASPPTPEEEGAEPSSKRLWRDPNGKGKEEEGGQHLLLELGAGSALASLSAATLLHHHHPSPSAITTTRLLATDVAETVETTLSENLSYNTSPRLPIHSSILPWGPLSPLSHSLLSPPEPKRITLLGADILYNPSSHSLLLSTVLSLLREGKRGERDRAFVAYKKRTEGDEGFFEKAREEGLMVERVWGWGEVGVWKIERGRVGGWDEE